MPIQGYPTQKKLNTDLVGFDGSKTTSQFGTLQKSFSDKVMLDTVPSALYRIHPAAKTATPNATYPKRVFTSAAHGASVNDVIRFEDTATNAGFEGTISSVPDANTIVLGAECPLAIIGTDTFFILRHVTPRVDETGSSVVTVSPSPIRFVLDSVDTEVSQDTATESNSVPLPIQYLNDGGVRTNLATDANIDNVVTALQPASGGSVINLTLTTTVEQTEGAPANTIGFIVQNESTNSNPIRFNITNPASTNLGVYLEAGRDSGFIPCGTDVSVCNTVSSTQLVSILWVTK